MHFTAVPARGHRLGQHNSHASLQTKRIAHCFIMPSCLFYSGRTFFQVCYMCGFFLCLSMEPKPIFPSFFFFVSIANTVTGVTFSQGGNHDYKIILLWLYQMSLSSRCSVYSCVCDLQVKFALSGGLFCLSMFVQFVHVWYIWNLVFTQILEFMCFPSRRINTFR